nr:hypothetical protein [Tanacetum cinerariifolium]
TEEMETVLTSMDAATVLAAGVADVPTGSGSIATASPHVPTGSRLIPTASPPADEVSTGSDVVPTTSLVFATDTMVTPYRRRKGKEVMDPYEAIRQAYLDGTDTESEPLEDPIARSMSSDSTAPLSPNHPLTHTTSTLVPILRRSARMARFRSSYESLPSSSPPDIPSRKRYRGMSELVKDDMDVEDDEEGDDKEEDEEMKESSDFNSVNEGAENEGPAVGDEVLAVGNEGLSMGVEGLSLGHSSRSLPESETPEIVSALSQPTQTTWMDPDDDIVNIDVHAYRPLAPPVQTAPSPRTEENH